MANTERTHSQRSRSDSRRSLAQEFVVVAALSLVTAFAGLCAAETTPSPKSSPSETPTASAKSTPAAASELADLLSAADCEIDENDPPLTDEELAEIDRAEPVAAFDGSQTLAAESLGPSADASLIEELQADDELWFVSSRRARCEADGSIHLHVWQYDGNGAWQSRKLDDLAAADPTRPTCFHVHGNRVTLAHSNMVGWRFYTTLTGGCTERPPLRLVIFSWPSDRICGRSRQDVQCKAVRAECHAYYLAHVIDRLDAQSKISLIGFSFGTRVIGGTLHLLGGGTLRGRALVERNVEDRDLRAIMLAAATDNDHFLPGRAFQMAPTQIDRMLITINRADPAMKWYPLLYQVMLRPRLGQQALGYTGFAGLSCVPALNGRIEHCDATCAVGRVHGSTAFEYLLPGLTEKMRRYVYFEPLGAE